MSEWISVKERVPNEQGYYLTFGKGGIGKMFVSLFGWSPYRAEKRLAFPANVTHWMPLPAAPTEREP